MQQLDNCQRSDSVLHYTWNYNRMSTCKIDRKCIKKPHVSLTGSLVGNVVIIDSNENGEGISFMELPVGRIGFSCVHF